jgi:hypothetical protein
MAEYEFTSEENKTFDSLAGALRRFALTFAVFAALLAVMGVMGFFFGRPFVESASWLIVGAATVFLALMFLKPVDNFRHITTTQGQDISELLGAMGQLNKAFGLLRIGVALILVAMIFGVGRVFLG